MFNQYVKATDLVIIVLTWLEDKKVFVKYYYPTGAEIQDYEDLPDDEVIEKILDTFFELNPELIKWSF